MLLFDSIIILGNLIYRKTFTHSINELAVTVHLFVVVSVLAGDNGFPPLAIL